MHYLSILNTLLASTMAKFLKFFKILKNVKIFKKFQIFKKSQHPQHLARLHHGQHHDQRGVRLDIPGFAFKLSLNFPHFPLEFDVSLFMLYAQ